MCDMCGGLTGDQYSDRLERNILTYGWTMQFVQGDGERNPAFGYTLGLSLRNHPEIIAFDPDPAWVYLGLKPLAWAVQSGEVFDEGDDLTAFFPPPERAELLRFPDSAVHLFTANAMFRRPDDPPLPALQLIWPTRNPLLQTTRAASARRPDER
ncbi:DUF4262 domain-containing protein [Kribbella turkmenica]|uniref:DUF4262 domain-containing protein n=1 Tax=Kribbella turkmenica TaxID=2530375 RepID=A0A4R4WM51_9ACTN|nr:DUF4262 domain-containing protein [Kribbella turkmenica]TDD17734.1 DUF4262 domain-containing protein [Kribbella turkmenica]